MAQGPIVIFHFDFEDLKREMEAQQDAIIKAYGLPLDTFDKPGYERPEKVKPNEKDKN